MIRKNQRIINLLNLASDAGLIFIAYFAALIVRFEWMKDAYISVPLYSLRYACVAGLYSILMVLVYCVFRMYGSYRFKDQSSEIVTILLLNGVGALGLVSLLYLTRIVDVSRLAIFFFWAFSSGFIIGKRVCVRAILRHYRQLGYNQKHVVVVGNGHFAHQYIQDVKNHPHMGFTVDGYVSRAQKLELGQCLGAYEDLEKILETVPAPRLR